MSEVITGAVAGAAVAACVAVAGVAVGVVIAVNRSLQWLSEKARTELERLEHELQCPPPVYATTTQARQEFLQILQRAESAVCKNQTLHSQDKSLASILALRHSTLGQFVSAKDWQSLQQSAPSPKAIKRIVKNAGRHFTQANAVYVSQSVTEVAAQLGFAKENVNRLDEGKRRLVLQDREGRALVAEIVEGDDGAKVNLDLTGFGDGSCHVVMDGILDGLAKKVIQLQQVKRRSHYRREGEILKDAASRKSKQGKGDIADNRISEHDRLRRQRVARTTKTKI